MCNMREVTRSSKANQLSASWFGFIARNFNVSHFAH